MAVRNGKIVSISAQRPAGEWEREYDGRGKPLLSGILQRSCPFANDAYAWIWRKSETAGLAQTRKSSRLRQNWMAMPFTGAPCWLLAESFRFGIVSTSDMCIISAMIWPWLCRQRGRKYCKIHRQRHRGGSTQPCEHAGDKRFLQRLQWSRKRADPGGYEPSRGIHFGSGNRTCAG